MGSAIAVAAIGLSVCGSLLGGGLVGRTSGEDRAELHRAAARSVVEASADLDALDAARVPIPALAEARSDRRAPSTLEPAVAAPAVAEPQAPVASSPGAGAAAGTVRIQAIGCGFVSTGTGSVISAQQILTNRHVVADSAEIRVFDHTGSELAVASVRAVSEGPDLAVIGLARPVAPAADPLVADPPITGARPDLAPLHLRLEPTSPDEAVVITGYPRGRPTETTAGHVLGTLLVPEGRVLELDIPAEPGSSGSPVLDATGSMIALVYAQRTDTGAVLALPADRLTALAADALDQPRATC